MLRKLLRGRKARLWNQTQLRRSEKFEARISKVRIRLEKLADWLAEGDPEEQEKMPVAYETPIEEYKSMQMAIPETPQEEKYLEQKREQIYAEVEEDRLGYFDSILGTDTYFRKVEPFEERISVDTVFQRKLLRDKNFIYDVNLADLTVESDVEYGYMDFLRPNEEVQKKVRKGMGAPLKPNIMKTVAECGKTEIDFYGFLKPGLISSAQMQKAQDFIFNQSIFFDLEMGEGNSIQSRIQRELKKAYKQSGFEENSVIFGNKAEYKFNAERVTLIKFLKGKKEKLVDGEELREYFFNFKDQTSFHLCRYLKNSKIEKTHILGFKFCKNEKYLVTSLKIGSRFLKVIKDIESGLYLGFYFVSDQPINLEILYRDHKSAEIYTLLPDDFNINRVLTKINLSEKSNFINHEINEEEISSVVRYFKENSDNLLDNTQNILSQAKEIWRCLNTERRVSIKNSDENLIIEEYGGNEFKSHFLNNSKGKIEPLYVYKFK